MPLEAVVTVPTVRPTPVMEVDAAACVNPTTFGTGTVDTEPPQVNTVIE